MLRCAANPTVHTTAAARSQQRHRLSRRVSARCVCKGRGGGWRMGVRMPAWAAVGPCWQTSRAFHRPTRDDRQHTHLRSQPAARLSACGNAHAHAARAAQSQHERCARSSHGERRLMWSLPPRAMRRHAACREGSSAGAHVVLPGCVGSSSMWPAVARLRLRPRPDGKPRRVVQGRRRRPPRGGARRARGATGRGRVTRGVPRPFVRSCFEMQAVSVGCQSTPINIDTRDCGQRSKYARRSANTSD